MSGDGQGSGIPIVARLLSLEQFVAQQEKENADLRSQLGQLQAAIFGDPESGREPQFAIEADRPLGSRAR